VTPPTLSLHGGGNPAGGPTVRGIAIASYLAAQAPAASPHNQAHPTPACRDRAYPRTGLRGPEKRGKAATTGSARPVRRATAPGQNQPRHHPRCTHAEVKASLAPLVAAHLLFTRWKACRWIHRRVPMHRHARGKRACGSGTLTIATRETHPLVLGPPDARNVARPAVCGRGGRLHCPDDAQAERNRG
jgi:hypothetical protein